MNVGSAARAMRSLDLLAGVDRVAQVAVEDAVGGAARASGRKFGSPVGPMKRPASAASRGSCPSVSGLQKPIQRQYWIGIGWSRPQASLELVPLLLGDARVVGELGLGPPGAASRIPYTTIGDPEQDRDRLDARGGSRISSSAVLPQPEDARGRGTLHDTAGSARRVARKVHPRARGAHGGRDAAAEATGRPRAGAPLCEVRSEAGGLLAGEPVLAVPGRADLGAVGEEVADARSGELDVLAVVERDLDGLVDVRPAGRSPWRP